MNHGRILGLEDGIYIDYFLSGKIINYGLIQGFEDAGIDVLDSIVGGGMVLNHGQILGKFDAIYVDYDINPKSGIFNYGTIASSYDGIDIEGTLAGTIFNCGIIQGQMESGIEADFTFGGTIRNHGGRIQGGLNAIFLGGGAGGSVVLSGPSHIVGSISGSGGGNDVLRFENMRGISATKQAELLGLAATDPGAGTVSLFGETITWLNIEDIQADANSLTSYSSLLTAPGLQSYAAALDNVVGLNDSFREFLKALNDVDAGLLNRITSNASGQTLRNSLNDIAREQDTNFFHLFSNQAASLRGESSTNGIVSNQRSGVQRSGLFFSRSSGGGDRI